MVADVSSPRTGDAKMLGLWYMRGQPDLHDGFQASLVTESLSQNTRKERGALFHFHTPFLTWVIIIFCVFIKTLERLREPE